MSCFPAFSCYRPRRHLLRALTVEKSTPTTTRFSVSRGLELKKAGSSLAEAATAPTFANWEVQRYCAQKVRGHRRILVEIRHQKQHNIISAFLRRIVRI